jgi:hypothetical protein
MDFLTTVLQTIAFVPTLVNEIEGLFSHRGNREERCRGVISVGGLINERCRCKSTDH